MELISAERPYESRKLNPQRLEAVRKHGGESVLDVGCGNGTYVFALKNEKQIRGVDYRFYEEWKTAPELFEVAEADALKEYANDSIDTIVSFETLEHLPDPEKALREYHRVCRHNIVVTVPNCAITPGIKKSNLLYSHWSDPSHLNFFTLDSLKALIESAGFSIKEAHYINRLDVRPFVLEAFKLRGPLAKVLSKVLRLLPSESYFITCLVVAEKRAQGA
ncbi:MAG: class I SAM-dependent methyltransferase [Bdellovibrionaceae bacterium]|nr:class I SAM-dependent methyltransferase [Bdellovibrionales bacterium]MCB9254441.1 class I SAM-dependent methyltransferase [Pseudobdellovibrionaceae bacterium]